MEAELNKREKVCIAVLFGSSAALSQLQEYRYANCTSYLISGAKAYV